MGSELRTAGDPSGPKPKEGREGVPRAMQHTSTTATARLSSILSTHLGMLISRGATVLGLTLVT